MKTLIVLLLLIGMIGCRKEVIEIEPVSEIGYSRNDGDYMAVGIFARHYTSTLLCDGCLILTGYEILVADTLVINNKQ